MADQRALTTFLDLLRIDSPSGHESAVAAYAAAALRDAGCAVRFDDTAAATGADTGNVIAVLPATAPGKRIALTAHMDCVDPCAGVEPTVVDGVLFSAGETVLGGDDKSGIAGAIEAVRRIAESDAPHGEVRVILTVSEEVGLRGAVALDPAVCDVDLCMVLDGDGDVGGIVTAAAWHRTFSATFTGVAAHAGVEPEKGVSAVQMAARAVARMELGRIDAQSTANVGTISGGRADNIVPPSCEVTGECRSLDPTRVEELRARMDALMREAAEELGGSVDIAWHGYEGFRLAEDSPQVRLLVAACGDAGIPARLEASGGGSDGNVFSGHGIPTVVLASGMTKVHSVSECYRIDDLERLVSLIEAVVRRAAA